ncbi:Do family serine endopeptidase [Botryobacter ruber]|uniref:Do family serine endopeptidase n=1 Tax=Botryobacter ruber TaxID=2171629 RepID=UPI000E0C5D9F|nr:Do family serine endopeptidase [Botryobacter ruber]
MGLKNILPLLIAGAVGGAVTFAAIELVDQERQEEKEDSAVPVFALPENQKRAAARGLPDGFGDAVQHSLQQVVHIRALASIQQQESQNPELYQLPEPFRHFFGDEFQDGDPYQGQRPHTEQLEQSGSGVIVSDDGYIVTNLHVVNQAQQVEVSLNDGRIFEAKLAGKDPATDLALIKIDGKALPFIRFADSDKVDVGDWVVAVGNPFNLSSTVTAGIVSAKARAINVLQSIDNSAIESFIQTDAAVNPGNSGGALVNMQGHLVGINTAIASPTGVYAGYAFAVPSNIVAKVIRDLREYGTVQRGYLGITLRELDWELAQKLKLKTSAGVVVESVMKGSAGAAAGLEEQDVIRQVDERPVANTAEFMGIIAQHRPGDKLQLQVMRDNKERTLQVKLKKQPGKEALLAEAKARLLQKTGLEVAPLTIAEKRRFQLRWGVRVVRLLEDKTAYAGGLREGFVIIRIDRQPVNSVQDVANSIQGARRGVLVEGVYPGMPGVYYYAIRLE